MGINASKATENVLNKIRTNLQQKGQIESTTSCNAKLGTITGPYWNGCDVIFKNYCNASSNVAIGSIAAATAETVQGVDQKLLANFLPGYNSSDSQQEITNLIEQELSQICQVGSNVTAELAAGNIDIETCNNSTFNYVNFADNVSNCAINSVLKDTVSAAQEANQESETGGLPNLCGLIGLNCTGIENDILYGGSSSILLCFCCCSLILIIIVIFLFKK